MSSLTNCKTSIKIVSFLSNIAPSFPPKEEALTLKQDNYTRILLKYSLFLILKLLIPKDKAYDFVLVPSAVRSDLVSLKTNLLLKGIS